MKAEIHNTPMGRECADHVQKMLDAGAIETRHFGACVVKEGDCAFLAFEGSSNRIQNIVGVMTYTLLEEEEPPRFYPGILYVQPCKRRQGIGRLLLTKAADLAEFMKCPEFNVHVMESNTDMQQVLDGMKWENWTFTFMRIVTNRENMS